MPKTKHKANPLIGKPLWLVLACSADGLPAISPCHSLKTAHNQAMKWILEDVRDESADDDVAAIGRRIQSYLDGERESPKGIIRDWNYYVNDVRDGAGEILIERNKIR